MDGEMQLMPLHECKLRNATYTRSVTAIVFNADSVLVTTTPISHK